MLAIWAATASAMALRPWPTLAYQRLAVASRSLRPRSSQTHTSSPRSMTHSAERIEPIVANGCQKRVSLMAPRYPSTARRGGAK